MDFKDLSVESRIQCEGFDKAFDQFVEYSLEAHAMKNPGLETVFDKSAQLLLNASVSYRSAIQVANEQQKTIAALKLRLMETEARLRHARDEDFENSDTKFTTV